MAGGRWTQWEFSLLGQNLLHATHTEFNTPGTRRELQRSIYGNSVMAVLNRIAGASRAGGSWRRHIAWLAGLAMLWLAATDAAAQPATSAEYQLKAATLCKLTQFVEWPAAAFRDATTPLVVGILGNDPFGTYLDEYVKDEKLGTHPLIVRRYKRAEDVTECHILFVSRSESGGLDKALATLKGQSVFTVSDVDRFAHRGGMLRFVTETGKIRFEINNAVAKAAELTISSKLLSSATIVSPRRD